MRTLLVVVDAEGIELRLQHCQRSWWCLSGEVALQGLMKALDLGAGLGVVRRGVLAGDPEALEFGLEEDLALARLATARRRCR